MLLQKLGSRIVNKAASTDLPDAASGFRAYSRDSLMLLNTITRFSYCMETIIQAGNKKLAIESIPIRTNPKTRESRLFYSTYQHVLKSAGAIVRAYIMYKPYVIFSVFAALFGVLGLIPFVRYAVLKAVGDEGNHLQSLLVGDRAARHELHVGDRRDHRRPPAHQPRAHRGHPRAHQEAALRPARPGQPRAGRRRRAGGAGRGRRAPPRRLGVRCSREHRDAFRALRGARETSARAFYGGVLRHRVLRRRQIWIGSRTVLDGADRVRVRDGGALRIGLGPFGLTSEHDTSVVRVRPGAELVCDGIVSLQRGVRVVVDGGRLTIGHGTNVNGLGTRLLCAQEVTIGAHCTFSWDVQVLDTDFHAITVDGAGAARRWHPSASVTGSGSARAPSCSRA